MTNEQQVALFKVLHAYMVWGWKLDMAIYNKGAK